MDQPPEPETDSITDIESLFHELADLSPAVAAQRLLELCPDCDQRRTIEQMLAADRVLRDPDYLEPFFSSGLPDEVVAKLADATTHQVCQWKGRFQLLDEIGRGGMGVVYRAWDPNLNRQVAVKLILAGEHASAEEMALFEQEAKAMANLRHPNIVTIHEYLAGENWFAMALLDGKTLQALTATQLLDRRSVARIMRDVAKAVAYAHTQQILHRDIKPANIFIQMDGTPVVTDFGISRVVSEDGQTNATQRGSLYYCAPERLRGEDACASDIYSLGAVLYASLTGRPPHYSASDSVRSQILNETILPAKTIDSSIDADLNTICMKCLEREPQRRYASAEELAADLDRFLNNQPIVARPPSLRYRARMAYRRNSVACLAGGAATLLLFIAIAAVGYAFARSQQSRIDQSERHLALARAVRDQRGLGQQFDSLNHLQAAVRLSPPKGESEKRSLREFMLESLCLTDLRVEQSLACETLDICAVDQYFTLCALESPQGMVCVRKLPSEEDLCEPIPIEGRLLLLRLSDDGRFLGIVTAGVDSSLGYRLQIFELNAKAACCLDTRINGTAWQFLSRTQSIAYGQPDGKLVEHRLASGQVREIADNVWANDLSFNEDETQVAVALDVAPYIKVFETLTGNPLRAPAQGATVQCIAWTNDGKLLAAGSRTEVRIWEMPSGELRDILKAHQSPVNALAFNDDGCLLASHSWDCRTNLWDVRTASRQLGFTGTSSMRFQRDSRRFAGVRVAGKYGIAELVTDECCRVVHVPEQINQEQRPAHDRGAWSVDFMPDQHLVATAHLDGVSFLTSESGRAPIHTIQVGHCSVCRFLPNNSGFITSGKSGVYFWPTRLAAEDPQALEVGWPGALARNPSLTGHTLSISSHCDSMAVMDQNRKCVHVEYFYEPHRSFDLSLPGPMDSVAVHPQTMEIAVGTWRQEPAGVLVFSLPSQAGEAMPHANLGQVDAWPIYSNAGDLLLSTDNGHRAIRTKGGQRSELFRISCPALTSRGIAAFSPSGKWLALNTDEATIQILNARNGQEVATLRIRDAGSVTGLSFSHDDAQLAASYQQRIVRVWDLREMDQRLAEQNLNWLSFSDAPRSVPITRVKILDQASSRSLAYPPAFAMVSEMPGLMNKPPQSTSPRKPLFDPRALSDRGHEFAKVSQWSAASQQFHLALETAPHNSKYWYLVALTELKMGHFSEYQRVCQEMVDRFASSRETIDKIYTTWTCALADDSIQNWPQVIMMADALVASSSHDPKGHTNRNTRGLLYLRMHRYQEARDELNTAMEIHSSGGNPSDWMGLAIAEYELGNRNKALEFYQRGDAWIEDRYRRASNARGLPWHELLEYSLFRMQAQQRLGLATKE